MSDKPESIIAEHPPLDDKEWSCRCARCGADAEWIECWECNGEGYQEDEDDDPDWGVETCLGCSGECGDYWCTSSSQWCKDNPLPGREDMQQGNLEWTVEKARTE
jgi:hypothetical protein